MRRRGRVYFFDTVTLSNFVLAGRLDLLVLRYGQRLHITPEVRDEVTDGVLAGYGGLSQVDDALVDGRFTSAAALSSAGERTIYRELLRALGPGEASCLACAVTRGGVVVTDDRTARDCCHDRDIIVTGTIGILKALSRDGVLSLPEADALLASMIEAGYHSPVRRISDLA